MSIIAAFVVLLLSVSANTDRVYSAVEGVQAPDFRIELGGDSTVSLSDFRGRYVVLNFWSASDADSRIAANRFDRFAKAVSEDESIRLLSVGFGSSERLFREIVRRDGMDNESQFFANGPVASQILKSYELAEGGLRSFLIDPKGDIVAVNPDLQTVKRIVAGI